MALTKVREMSRAAWIALASLVLWSTWAFAQDQTGSTAGGGGTVTHTSTEVWYGQWWVWAVGIAVFLIIVIALTNRGGRSNP